MTVYLDVIWSLNLLFDSLLLYLTAIILKRKVHFWRVLGGGLIGSIIILLNFTSLHLYSSHPISKLLFSVIMVLMVFGYKRLSFFIKALMTFYVATFLIGGALIGVHFFIQYDSRLTAEVLRSSVEGFGDPISWGFVLIGFPIAWHFSKKNIEAIEMTKIRYDQIVSVSLMMDGQTFHYKGLVDSGNQLYDPVSKMPVMFVSVKKQWEDVPEPIKILAENPDPLEMKESTLPEEWQNRLRIVPCRVVGQEHQLIFTIKPDHILIEQNGTQYLWEKGLVSFTMQELSAEDAFQCIVHPKMLTGQQHQGDNEKVS
ncbi:sigma-E processing peptidase SpoIIGA [Neobacillus dielmonensis]|uniref:sigma-E processing peptidase SpoIIGA n=1 Tax=Neobacillus dielmonensis TaxID=1347369 RepID=UPI0005A7A0BB|nr:sigma-E processing peptidase SpoIIGA [Neobacillus dielmonensis]